MRQPFSILQIDLKDERGNIRSYHGGFTCPMYFAAKRQFGSGVYHVVGHRISFKDMREDYILERPFIYAHYLELVAGTNFHTFVNIPD